MSTVTIDMPEVDEDWDLLDTSERASHKACLEESPVVAKTAETEDKSNRSNKSEEQGDEKDNAHDQHDHNEDNEDINDDVEQRKHKNCQARGAVGLARASNVPRPATAIGTTPCSTVDTVTRMLLALHCHLFGNRLKPRDWQRINHFVLQAQNEELAQGDAWNEFLYSAIVGTYQGTQTNVHPHPYWQAYESRRSDNFAQTQRILETFDQFTVLSHRHTTVWQDVCRGLRNLWDDFLDLVLRRTSSPSCSN
jgi:hypothetical protein